MKRKVGNEVKDGDTSSTCRVTRNRHTSENTVNTTDLKSRENTPDDSMDKENYNGENPVKLDCDDYGFLLDDREWENPKCHVYQRGPKSDAFSEEKWEKLLKNEEWEKHQVSSGKLRACLQKGVPHKYRGKLWMKLLDVDMLAMKANFSYKANVIAMREQLVELGICEFRFSESLNVLGNLKEDFNEDQENNSTHRYIDPITLRQIFCDIERTYPTHKMFSTRSPEGQEGCAALFRVLAVYARYNRQVGYCQGMSYIAGLLLMEMTEAEAFWCLVALFERPKYLQGFFDVSLGRMRNYAAVFKKILCQRLPSLARHLWALNLQPLMFLTPWFLCLYAELPCWDTVLAIWDYFLLEGSSVIIKVALAVMEVFESELLQITEMSQLLPKLLHLPFHIASYEPLVPVIWGTVIEPWEVNGLLAVISEEDSIRQKRKRELSGEMLDDHDSGHKRRRIQGTTENSPSIFRKFLNFFTGEDARKTRKSNSQRLLRRAQTARLAKRRQFHNNDHVTTSEEFGGTPSTPTDDNPHQKRALEEFTFRMFNTPVSVRQTKGRQLQTEFTQLHTPEVEMEAMGNLGKSSRNEEDI